jgi:uncharacterized membrane protein
MSRVENRALVTFMAIAAPAVLAMTCLVSDAGRVCRLRRALQDEATKAVAAAARDWREEGLASGRRPDQAAASLDAVDSRDGTDVVINVPPKAGRNRGNPDYIEAIARRRAPTYFARFMREQPPAMMVRAEVPLTNPTY